MVTLSYLHVALVSLGLAVVYLGLGAAIACWWASRPRPQPWARSTRDFDQDRFGLAMDGSLSRIRWLPVNHAEEE